MSDQRLRDAEHTGDKVRLFIERRRQGKLRPGDDLPNMAWRKPGRRDFLAFATEPMYSEGYLRTTDGGIWVGPPVCLSDQSDHHVTTEYRWDVSGICNTDALCVLMGDVLLCIKLFQTMQPTIQGDVIRVSYRLDYNRDEWLKYMEGR